VRNVEGFDRHVRKKMITTIMEAMVPWRFEETGPDLVRRLMIKVIMTRISIRTKDLFR